MYLKNRMEEDKMKKTKESRREYMEDINKLYGSDAADIGDRLMIQSVENETEFVRKTIEIALTDMDNIHDLPQAAAVIARFWNTELLGIIGKMETVLNYIVEFEIKQSKIHAEELQGRKIALTKKGFMYIVNQTLDRLSSFDRA